MPNGSTTRKATQLALDCGGREVRVQTKAMTSIVTVFCITTDSYALLYAIVTPQIVKLRKTLMIKAPITEMAIWPRIALSSLGQGHLAETLGVGPRKKNPRTLRQLMHV